MKYNFYTLRGINWRIKVLQVIAADGWRLVVN